MFPGTTEDRWPTPQWRVRRWRKLSRFMLGMPPHCGPCLTTLANPVLATLITVREGACWVRAQTPSGPRRVGPRRVERWGWWGKEGGCKNLIVKSKEYRGSIVILCDGMSALFKTHESSTFVAKLKILVHFTCTLSHAPYVHDCGDTPNPSVTL